jgi:tRNA threonylcarbamoyladenosine biosynthesis protein TsaE
MHLRLTSGGPDVTRGIGEAVGRIAEGPLALLLVGDYGTGKTTFVQGLARGLAIPGPVRSPSFNILKRYDGGRLVLVHADLYRTRSEPDIEELGIPDILTAHAILAVEWPGRYLPPAREMPNVSVTFSVPASTAGKRADEGRRNLEFSWQSDCPEAVAEVLGALAAR